MSGSAFPSKEIRSPFPAKNARSRSSPTRPVSIAPRLPGRIPAPIPLPEGSQHPECDLALLHPMDEKTGFGIPMNGSASPGQADAAATRTAFWIGAAIGFMDCDRAPQPHSASRIADLQGEGRRSPYPSPAFRNILGGWRKIFRSLQKRPQRPVGFAPLDPAHRAFSLLLFRPSPPFVIQTFIAPKKRHPTDFPRSLSRETGDRQTTETKYHKSENLFVQFITNNLRFSLYTGLEPEKGHGGQQQDKKDRLEVCSNRRRRETCTKSTPNCLNRFPSDRWS